MAAFQEAIFHFLTGKKKKKQPSLPSTDNIHIWKQEDEKESKSNVFLSAYLVA